ncbi:MAG: chloride channel protein [Spirochaetia bacterium]|nr:chloride channel protein [Spirochaetia bacterium]
MIQSGLNVTIFNETKLFRILKIKNEPTVYIASAITGVFTGLATYIFVFSLEQVHDLFETYFPSYNNPDILNENNFFSFHPGYWPFIFLPAIGGLVAGLISHQFSNETSGSGMDSFIESFHQMEGKLRGRIAFYKIFSTVFTLGFGGSGGKEGPVAQIGGSIGSKLNNILGGGAKARRTLLLAGAAGGLGAIFHSPLGGALTAVEMIYKEDIESDALLPCIISSISSYLLYSTFMGFHSVYSPPEMLGVQPFGSYFFYILLGFLSYFSGNIFIKIFNAVRNGFDKLPVHHVLKPAIGGLIVGLIGYLFPFILGTGESFVQQIMEIKSAAYSFTSLITAGAVILSILSLKIIATSFTIGSGGSGGMFGPSLYIGGLLGFLIGIIAQFILPDTLISLPSFMLVGMGTFYSGIARAPIAGMIMICEMIGSYVLLPPLMIGSIITLTLSHKIAIYRTQLENRFKSPAHSYDLDIMRSIKIEQYSEFFKNHAVVSKEISLQKLKTLAKKIQASDFVISSDNKEYFGMISLKKDHEKAPDLPSGILNEGTTDTSKKKLKTSRRFIYEIAERVPAVKLENTLGDALNIILEYDFDKVAIVSQEKLVGYLRFNDIMIIYYKKINKHSIPDAKGGA